MSRNVKQVIVVRRDLRMRRSEVSALIAKAGSKFFIDSDESDHPSHISIDMSASESLWVSSGSPNYVVLGVPSLNAMESLLFKAETEGLSVYRITGTRNIEPDDPKAGQESQVMVAAIGPDYSEDIDKITSKLKLF